jgi:lysyl endopeptidase
MRKNALHSFLVAALLFFQPSVFSQKNVSIIPAPLSVLVDKDVPVLQFLTPNLEQLRLEDQERDRNGQLYRIGIAQYSNITTQNAGKWKNLPNGDRQWQLRVKSAGAEALSFLFEIFKIYDGSVFTISDPAGVLRHKPMTAIDVEDHGRQNAALCFGDDLVLTLTEPVGSRPSEIYIDRIMYNYRSTGNPNIQKINESETCEVNVNCSPVGDSWQDEKRGVARIYVVEGGSAGWCTGSLINNAAQNCKPYFLTALHCGVSTSAANMTQWKFYFRYESPNCTNPSTAGTLDDYFITGCVRLADSGDGGGNSGSDFLLVQLGSASNEATTIANLKSANFNAYWNGWNANTSATSGGTGIHHPAGDIKKISTFSGNTVSTQWGSASGSHWRVTWTSNANGHGVTEGGSSGSPLFNNSQGYMIGTLTGGSSYCNTPSSPDQYGKMSYHWTSNGTAANRQLKPWLDPSNTGVLTLAGSSDPCSAPTAPVANFSGTPTTVAPGGTVAFTDLSSGSPTSWSWSISPGASGTDWAYTGSTSSTSQNPQVIFNTVGQYTIALTASNSIGSDTETKTNYITVQVSTGPCTPSVTEACDEYIQNVNLGSINNTTSCTTGGYMDYSSLSTSVNKGSTYTVTVTPAIGTNIGQAYTNDEIAVWIDYNDDNDFTDAGEQVGYVLVAQGWSNQFQFTVPTSATTGAVRMRVRISYSVVAEGGAPIDPCAVATFGETEDYTVNIQAAASGVLSLQCPGNQTIYATQSTVVPNLTSTATSSTTCPGGAVSETQSPAAGTALQNGQNVITVSATDQCGNTQTCTTTITYINNLGITDNELLSQVNIYPNPFNEELNIDLSSVKNETVVVEIYDISGKLIHAEISEDQALLNISLMNIAKGQYHVHLRTNASSVVKRISKI